MSAISKKALLSTAVSTEGLLIATLPLILFDFQKKSEVDAKGETAKEKPDEEMPQEDTPQAVSWRRTEMSLKGTQSPHYQVTFIT